MVANHTSWWDGFLVFLLHKKVLGRAEHFRSPIFTVMLEAQLEKHSWLRRLGCSGIVPGDGASIRTSFGNVATAAKEHGSSWVLFFPQGRITASWQRPLGFERGIEVLTKMISNAVIVPLALHIEPLTATRPTAFVLAGSPVSAASCPDSAAVEDLVVMELDRLQNHIRHYGERSAEMWTASSVLSDGSVVEAAPHYE